jgi:hypothetical protein
MKERSIRKSGSRGSWSDFNDRYSTPSWLSVLFITASGPNKEDRQKNN